MDEQRIIQALKKSFANDDIKRQVLTPEWYQLNIQTQIDSTGFCFSASQVLYRLTGGQAIWRVRYIYSTLGIGLMVRIIS